MTTTHLYNKLGVKNSSLLGFGTMRLPVDSNGAIEKKEATYMLHYAIDNGINYIDTAYVYHQGESENFLGEALKNGYRDRVSLVTKMPTFLLKDSGDLEKYLDEQLLKTKTDHFDFYLLHTLTIANWQMCKKTGALEFLDRMVEKGKIRFPSFSFHDGYKLFEEIINAYNWKMCQIQFNYLDINYQAGLKGLKLAGDKNIPVVIMEPLKGGKLAINIDAIKDIWVSEGYEYNPVKLAFRYVAAHEEVATILSGMSSIEQMKSNIELFNKIDRSPLTAKEEELYTKSREYLLAKTKIGCTSCAYCMPCPKNVRIPDIFDKYNNAYIFDDIEFYKKSYYVMYTTKNQDASQCVACGQCEKQCPQNLPIINTLKDVVKLFN